MNLVRAKEILLDARLWVGIMIIGVLAAVETQTYFDGIMSKAQAAGNCGKYHTNAVNAADQASTTHYAQWKEAVATESFAWSAIYRNCKEFGGN